MAPELTVTPARVKSLRRPCAGLAAVNRRAHAEDVCGVRPAEGRGDGLLRGGRKAQSRRLTGCEAPGERGAAEVPERPLTLS